MTPGQTLMFGVGALALAVGLAILFRSARGTDSQRYARRIVGMMATALGAVLIIYALGLSGDLGDAQ